MNLVLRILRGAGESGLPTLEIVERLIEEADWTVVAGLWKPDLAALVLYLDTISMKHG